MNEQTNTPENTLPIADADALTTDTDATANEGNEESQTPTADEATVKKINYDLEIKELKDKYLRIYAEFDTAKRRMARERIELAQTAGREIITELLPILDDFERAFKAAAPNTDLKGFELIYHKLKTSLEQKGLKAMNSAGEPFNPELHEAIAEIPAPNDALTGKIIDEVEKGYYLHQTIIRYAKVVVGK